MARAQAKAFKIGSVGSVQRRTVLQLLLCHCFIFLVAVASGAFVPPILVACLLSFLLMLSIPYDLHLLEITLDRLARGLPVEPLSLRWRWPLKGLFVLVNSLGQQTGQQVQMEQRNVAYRDQLLQQVGKTAAQEERNRLARDLHDSIKQQIFSIAMSAAAIKARWEHNPASVRTVIDDIERTAQEAQVEMQALLQQLRPTALENVGLIESLRMQCQALGYRTGAEVTAELGDLPPDELLPIGAQEMIFRIVQEGFANVAHHARASHVWLSLKWERGEGGQNDALLVEIGDDGQGFDLAQANERPNTYGGMGLSNVRERISSLGGTVSIWSLPGKGTTLHLCIPLIKPEENVEAVLAPPFSPFRKARRILYVGMAAVEVAAAFMLLYIPALIARWPVFICLIVALACWLWAQQYRLQAALDFGRKHVQHLALQVDSHGLLSGTLLLCMLFPFYFTSFRVYVDVPNNAWIRFSFFGLFIIAIIVAFVLYTLNSGRYYKALKVGAGLAPPSVLALPFRSQLQQIIIDWMVWIIVVALTVFLWNFFPTILQDSAVQAMGLVVLIAWFLVNLLKSIHIARWHRMLSILAGRGNPVWGTGNGEPSETSNQSGGGT